jgi:hypothetical protein
MYVVGVNVVRKRTSSFSRGCSSQEETEEQAVQRLYHYIQFVIVSGGLRPFAMKGLSEYLLPYGDLFTGGIYATEKLYLTESAVTTKSTHR